MIDKCNADFVDGDGDTCKTYLDEKYCTPDGGYGENWKPKWDSFSEQQVDGYDARNCPECGCISTKTNN